MDNARYIPPRRWRDRTPRRWQDSFAVRWLALVALGIVVSLIVLVLIYRHAWLTMLRPPSSPMMILARWMENPPDMAIGRPQDADPRVHQEVAAFGGSDQAADRGLALTIARMTTDMGLYHWTLARFMAT
jgi:hypothetical protein